VLFRVFHRIAQSFLVYCTLFPCYSTVVSYYCPLLPCYSTLRPYYMPFLSRYPTLPACYSTVRSSFTTLIPLISLSPHCCWQLQTQNYSRLGLKYCVLDLHSSYQTELIYTMSKYFLVFKVMHTLMHRWIILRYQLFIFSIYVSVYCVCFM
jgi:hypothetical protein